MRIIPSIPLLSLGALLAACGGGSAPSTSAVATPPPAQIAPPAQAATALLTEVENWRQSKGLPGLSVVIVEQDQIRTASTGTRRIGGSNAILENDSFQVGSLTKSMSASVIARLVEKNKLRWDATIGELFPSWRDEMRPELVSVTVEQLLRHRGGFQHDLDDADAQALMPYATGDLSKDRMLVGKYFLSKKPPHAPNALYAYSNVGYLLIGLIAEVAGGDKFEHLIERELFVPLQIAGFLGLPEDGGANSVAGHIFESSAWKVAQYSDLTRLWLKINYPAGGASLSMAGYGRYLREHLRGLAGKSDYLSAASLQRMHTPVDNYGSGWAVANDAVLGPVSFHSGSIGTYYSMVILMPQRERAVAVSCNCYGGPAEIAVDELTKILAAKR